MIVKPVELNDPLPRYYQVYASLLERIKSGEFQPGDAIPSERILVSDYQVSRITIVKALDLLEQDGLIDRQHGRGTYVTSPPTPPEPRPLQVAFLLGRTSKPYPYTVLIGAVQTAMQHNVQIQVIGSHENVQEARFVHSAIQNGVDGMIVYPTPDFPNEALYRELYTSHFPFVMVDRYYPQIDSDRVIFDDEAASYQLTEYLIQQGHNRIAIVPLAEVMVTSVRDRIRGYQKALVAHGIEYDEDLVWLDVYEALDRDKPIRKDQPSDRRLLQRLEKDQPTALVGINYDVSEQILADLSKIKTDRMSSVLEGAALDTSYELNISLAAISNRWFSNENPSLVALALQSGETLGAQAMELLLRRIKQTDTGPMKSVVVPMEIHRLI